jgi:hypothetical protein
MSRFRKHEFPRCLPEVYPEPSISEPWGQHDHWKACDKPHEWEERMRKQTERKGKLKLVLDVQR